MKNPLHLSLALVTAGILMAASNRADAQTYIFDPGTTGTNGSITGGTDGSGTWDNGTTLDFYNSATSPNPTVYVNSTGGIAQFGTSTSDAGTGSTETVTLGSTVEAGTLNIDAPNYLFTSASTNTLESNVITYGGTSGSAEIDANVSADTITSGQSIVVNSAAGGTLTFSGDTITAGNALNINGSASSYTGTIVFNNTSLTTSGNIGRAYYIQRGTVDYTGTNTIADGSGGFDVNDAGGTATATVNVGTSTANAELDLGTYSGIGTATTSAANTSALNVGYSTGTSTMNVYGTVIAAGINITHTLDSNTSTAATSSTLNFKSGTSYSLGSVTLMNTTATTPAIQPSGANEASSATLNISGGTLGIYASPATSPATSNTSSAGTSINGLYIGQSENVNDTTATVNISAGALIVNSSVGIIFGSINGSSSGLTNSAILNLSGGTLELGDGGGIKTANSTQYYTQAQGTVNTAHTASDTEINLSGGTIQTLAGGWSSNMNMTLTKGTNGNVTFQTLSGASTTLGGTLSGSGGLTVTGNGTLTLTAGSGIISTDSGVTVANTNANTYSGTTEVTSGATLQLNSNFTLAATSSLLLDSATNSDVVFNFATTGSNDTILTLDIAGVQVAAGTYTAAQLNQNYGTDFSFLSGGAQDTLTVAPEPSTWAMLLGGLGLLFFVIRRRQSAI